MWPYEQTEAWKQFKDRTAHIRGDEDDLEVTRQLGQAWMMYMREVVEEESKACKEQREFMLE